MYDNEEIYRNRADRSVISGCAADTSVQETPPAAVEAQETESKVEPVIIALGLFLLAGVLTANTVANDISGAIIP